MVQTEYNVFRELFHDYRKRQSRRLMFSKPNQDDDQLHIQKGMHAMRMTQIINHHQTGDENDWLSDHSYMASEKFLRKTGAFKRITLSQVKPPPPKEKDSNAEAVKQSINSRAFTTNNAVRN